jgi:1,4-dihydroxy-2-naphthoate octaprenyltransferase
VTRLRAWAAAVRPRTLSAAVVPVAVGTAVAARAGQARPGVAVAALAGALLLQVGTNLVNDWGDCRRGADGPERLGPRRAVQSGWLTPGEVLAGAALAFVVASAIGGWLVARGGWPIAGIGIGSLVSAVAYTAGPFPLAYHGLGEAFVFLFFGPLAVCGAELVQAGHVTRLALLASLPVGSLAAAILLVNNVRDVDGDRRAGKRSLVVRLGRGAGRRLYTGAVACAFLGTATLAAWLCAPGALLSWLAAPLAVAPLRAVLRHTDGPTLNAALAATARLHLAFGLLLAAGLAW